MWCQTSPISWKTTLSGQVGLQWAPIQLSIYLMELMLPGLTHSERKSWMLMLVSPCWILVEDQVRLLTLCLRKRARPCIRKEGSLLDSEQELSNVQFLKISIPPLPQKGLEFPGGGGVRPNNLRNVTSVPTNFTPHILLKSRLKNKSYYLGEAAQRFRMSMTNVFHYPFCFWI